MTKYTNLINYLNTYFYIKFLPCTNAGELNAVFDILTNVHILNVKNVMLHG